MYRFIKYIYIKVPQFLLLVRNPIEIVQDCSVCGAETDKLIFYNTVNLCSYILLIWKKTYRVIYFQGKKKDKRRFLNKWANFLLLHSSRRPKR